MIPPSTRARRRRAVQRQQAGANQTLSVSPRRSSQLRSKCSEPVGHASGPGYLSQCLIDPQPTDLGALRPAEPTIHPPLPISSSARKRRPEGPTEVSTERPPKRARLTLKNLRALDTMAGRVKKSTEEKSTRLSSSTTTTTDKNFATKLQQNNVVFTSFDAQAPDDFNNTWELLDAPRESQPPDQLEYKRYLVNTEDRNNEISTENTAYTLLAKRAPAEAEISGYLQRYDHAWSTVDNHITKGLSDAKPDIYESYRQTDYPSKVVEGLSSALAPTSYNTAMPAFAVECKGSKGDMKEAKLQCAYDGALMTEGAHAIHEYMNNAEDDFYGTTQALTVSFNGENINFYSHHALQVPTRSESAAQKVAGSGENAETTTNVEYHQYLLSCDNPRASYEDFKKAYKHTRNAQETGYKLATQRKDALWAYSKANNSHALTSIPVTPPESSNHVTHPTIPQPTTTQHVSTTISTPFESQQAPDSTSVAKRGRARKKVAGNGPSEAIDKPQSRRSRKTRRKQGT